MSAKIIPFRSATASSADIDAPMTVEAIHDAIQQLETADHDLQLRAHAINLSIGDVRQQRLMLLRRLDASRSA